MKRFWLIFQHEYTRHVLRRRFLFALLSIPLWIAFSFAMAFISILISTNRLPVGYVDQAKLISSPALPASERSGPLGEVPFNPYPGESEARAALQANQIQAYFVLPPDYRSTNTADLVYLKRPSGGVISMFSDLVRYNLISENPGPAARRVMEGRELVLEATQDNRKLAAGQWFNVIAPLVAAGFLMFAMFTSSGYLMQAVVEEKENRTMEILVTSVSPGLIMNAKIIALIAVGLTQLLVWIAFPLALIPLANALLEVPVAIDWGVIALIFLTAVPTFVLVSALMATIGATLTEAQEGQQITTLVTLPVMLPVLLVSAIIANPGSPVALALTFFPMTAALTILIRMAFASVPTWQVIVSTALIILAAAGAMLLSGRVFRLGMLRYGKRLGWKDVLGALSRREPSAQSARGKEAA